MTLSGQYEWFYESEGKRLGPVTVDAIRELLVREVISRETLVWKPEFGPEWKPVGLTDAVVVPTKEGPRTSSDEVRSGIQQAKAGDDGLTIITLEAAVIALIAGVNQRSWAVGIFTLIGVMVAFLAMASSEKTANLFAGAIGIAWGVAFFWLATWQEAGMWTAIAFAVLAAALSAGLHMLGFQHLRDL